MVYIEKVKIFWMSQSYLEIDSKEMEICVKKVSEFYNLSYVVIVIVIIDRFMQKTERIMNYLKWFIQLEILFTNRK